MLMLATTAAMSEQFNKNNILILEEMGYEVHVAGNFEEGNPISSERLEAFKQWLVEHHACWHHIPATRNPFDAKNNGAAYKQVIELIKEHNYDFIHCHTPIGSVIGRAAAHKTKTPVMYTAHGFHFYKGAPLLNWVLYYPVERFFSRWTDVLVLINQEDFARAKKSFHAKRTEYIPGVGIELEKFPGRSKEQMTAKRTELGLNADDVMLLSVGELNANKNHEVVIRALAKLNNPNVHYFIAGQGEFKERLSSVAKELGLQKNVHLLGYRDDVNELLQCADLYVFPSKREGLSVALMEAIASKVPVICSNIRGNTDLVLNQDYMFNPNDVNTVYDCMRFAMETEHDSVIEENYRNLEKCTLDNVESIVHKLYSCFSSN